MPRFVVHEHHASRLHWDFRLELSGVLVSWAVPKGPSMDPADKRLAVRVEDHELSYIDFEGAIEEGSYGAGEVLIWDSGEYSLLSGSPAEGRLEFELTGDKLRGAFALILMKGKQKEWLLIKKRDDYMERGFLLRHVLTRD
jgi:bifunctional non-homologous end joining protein LigD